MTKHFNGLEFDPGFGPYILAFRGTIEYLYADISRFKNFSQRKLKFKQYYKKILEVFRNNLGFYIGCLMWAEYIKTQPEQQILNNNCFGQSFDDNENTYEVDFMIKFTELFSKDMQYFLGEKYEFPLDDIKILNFYREFLIVNGGFVNSKVNTDIILPDGIKNDNAETYKLKIDEVIKGEDLSKFLEYKDLLL